MYIMSYFRTEAEALHLAISDDGLNWAPLNGNRPVLGGRMGARTLRDPHVMHARDGRFHLFATDGWGSTDVIHCSSSDLLEWSEQEAIPVMASVPGARNCWAPECYYDHEESLYRLIWSSTVSADGPADVWDHRIWGAVTADFRRYSPPSPFFDPGYSVIDATVAYHDGWYLMAFKDERGENRLGTEYKAIRVSTSPHGGGPWESVSELVTPAPVEGPALLRRDGRWLMLYDHFMEGRYGACESEDGLRWRVVSTEVRFPPGARHASVLTVEGETADRLRRAV